MKKRNRKEIESIQLEMTPMIDVVFQLLIFFLVTLKPEDIFSKLEISRPAPDSTASPEDQIKDMLEITIHKDGVALQRKRVSLEEVERQLTRMASINPKTSILIKCTMDSPHWELVKVLDICAKVHMNNISVFTL